MNNVVVVGASLAGFTAAAELRRHGVDSVKIIGDEPTRPYDRPPLSKDVLSGAKPLESAALGAAAGDIDGIDWLLGERAASVDLGARTVALASGGAVDYDGLVIATGARPRKLPGVADRPGLHVLRTLDDCSGLISDLDQNPQRVVVVGAGFIGAEVAAACRARELEVTVVDPLALPMVRVVGEVVGEAVADLHRRNGVDLRLGIGVEAIVGDERVRGVTLNDGTTIDADVVVVGIGVIPNTEWLEGSGLVLDGGVVCDATTLAAPGVVAAGDVARWLHPTYGSVRIEHWDNAVQMGVAAAVRLLATDADAVPYAPVPWFWSDQFDAKIQLAGRADPAANFVVVEGSITDNKFLGLFGQDDEVIGALAWNWPAKCVRWRMRMQEGPVSWAEALG